jgi:hypothetical protein
MHGNGFVKPWTLASTAMETTEQATDLSLRAIESALSGQLCLNFTLAHLSHRNGAGQFEVGQSCLTITFAAI